MVKKWLYLKSGTFERMDIVHSEKEAQDWKDLAKEHGWNFRVRKLANQRWAVYREK